MEAHVYSTIQERTDDLTSSDDSDDSDLDPTLYTENIGTFNEKYTNHKRFINNKNPVEYEKFRNQYFTPDIEKKIILVDTKNLTQITRNTSEYVIYFNNATSENTLNGYYPLKNVIGFRLIKAMIPNIPYQIHEKNNIIIIKKTGVSELIKITLDPGSYTAVSIASHIQIKLLAHSDISTATVTFSSTTKKYTFTLDGNFSLHFLEAQNTYHSSAWRKLGFNKTNQSDSEMNTTQISTNPIDQSHHFVDLVVDEIPYHACKMNPGGLNIIDRIPLNESSGSLVYYDNPYCPDIYFHPIELNKLSIKLYEDTHETLYQSNNLDNSFEFEITLLKNTSLLQ